MKTVGVVLTLAACLIAPAVASADSGSITNVAASGDGQVSATYTTTSTTCTSYNFCGWYPHARQVPATQQCGPWQADQLTYVGDYQDNPGTQTGTDTFYPVADAVRLCLYINDPNDTEPLVAEYVYPAGTQPSPTPPPATDSPQPVSVPPMTASDARTLLPGVLRGKYGRRFTHRTHYKRSCYRWTSQTVRCDVRWENAGYRYRGNVKLRNDPDDPANSFVYTITVHRKRLHPRPAATPAPAPQPNCDPNYSGCLNPNASDYDCVGGSGNGPYYTGQVRVLGVDHFDLDRDGDGIGCD
jgi:hypothetical protein